MTTTTLTDWRYSEDRMETRQQALKLLLARYGSELDKEGNNSNYARALKE